MSVAVNAAHPQSITEQANEAVQSACEGSLLKGLIVTVADGNELVQIRLDGSKRVIDQLTPLQKPAQRTIHIR